MTMNEKTNHPLGNCLIGVVITSIVLVAEIKTLSNHNYFEGCFIIPSLFVLSAVIWFSFFIDNNSGNTE